MFEVENPVKCDLNDFYNFFNNNKKNGRMIEKVVGKNIVPEFTGQPDNTMLRILTGQTDAVKHI